MKVVNVHASNPEARGLLRPLVERIIDFCIKYESEADPEIMYEEIVKSYVMPSPPMALFAAVDDDGKIVSHMVATIEVFFGSRSVSILQYWKDDEVKVPDEMKFQVFEALRDWGEACGATRFRVYARNEVVAKIFETKYGFQRDRKVMMNTPLDAFVIKNKGAGEEEGVGSGFRNSGDPG